MNILICHPHDFAYYIFIYADIHNHDFVCTHVTIVLYSLAGQKTRFELLVRETISAVLQPVGKILAHKKDNKNENESDEHLQQIMISRSQ